MGSAGLQWKVPERSKGVKYNTSVTDPPNNKALTAWNDSMITHRSFLNPAQVHDPRFVKKSFSMIYTSLIHLAHALFFCSLSPFYSPSFWWKLELFALLHTWFWIYSYPVWLSFIQYKSRRKRIEALVHLMRWRSSSATVGLHEQGSNWLFVQSITERQPIFISLPRLSPQLPGKRKK